MFKHYRVIGSETGLCNDGLAMEHPYITLACVAVPESSVRAAMVSVMHISLLLLLHAPSYNVHCWFMSIQTIHIPCYYKHQLLL